MASQGFRGSGNNLFVYTELPAGQSSAVGLDSTDSGKFKIQSLTTSGAVPTGTVQLTIDPSTNGNITLNPNGTGIVIGTTGFSATTGDVTLVAGNINLPATDITASEGVINLNSSPFLHAYGTRNIFLGNSAGNFTLTTGSAINNTSIGYNTLSGIVTGAYNTALGQSAGSSYTGAESSNIAISNTGQAGDNNSIRIGTQGNGSGQQETCYIAGITGVTVANAAYVTLNTSTGQLGTVAGGSLLGWSVVTSGAQNMAVNYGYITNFGSTVTLTLPAVSPVGSMIRVTGLGTGGWMIAQNGGNSINFGAQTTTAGVGGSLSSTNQFDSIELVCVTANAQWNVLSVQGNVTFI